MKKLFLAFSLIFLCFYISYSENSLFAKKLDPFLKKLIRIRDPFRKKIMIPKKEEKIDLENYAISQFQLLGVMTGPERLRALIQDPDGKSHIVYEHQKIGLNHGRIQKITEDSILVKEKRRNILGQWETYRSWIRYGKSPKKASLVPPFLGKQGFTNAGVPNPFQAPVGGGSGQNSVGVQNYFKQKDAFRKKMGFPPVSFPATGKP